MTKPADSDQIARREQRAHKFWQEWLNTQEGGTSLFLATSEPGKTLFPFAAAFAASERQAVIEECANALENGANQWDADAKTAARNGDSAGMAAYDSGDRKRVIGVLLENGHTWEYDAATVREARHEELPKMPRFIRERFGAGAAQPGDDKQEGK